MQIVQDVAAAMQALFGRTMDDLGRETGCIQRERKFCGSGLLRTLVLTLLQHPAAKDRDYQTVAAQLGIDVTEEAVKHRFNSGLVAFLEAALEHVLTTVLTTQASTAPLFGKFIQVLIGDSTTITLPDELADEFPGCGGKGDSGKAALKIQVLWDLVSGKIVKLLIEPGRAADLKSPIAAEPLPAGALSIFDLGYFSLERFREVEGQGAYWISRLLHGTQVFDVSGKRLALLAFLEQQASSGVVDVPVIVGEKEQLSCRLLALRVPPEVAARRRQRIIKNARDHGRQASQEYLAMQDWTIYLTNAKPALLTWKEVVVLYRARWQIELLFKLWKSHNRLANREITASPERQMAVFYAKLIGVIVQHWILLTATWTNDRRSLRKAAHLLRDWIIILTEALDDLERLCLQLDRLTKAIGKTAQVNCRRKHPSLYQLLENPELLDYKLENTAA